MRRKYSSIGSLAAAGIVSAGLAFAITHSIPSATLIRAGLENSEGVFLGIVLSCYFWVIRKQHSIWKAVAFTLATTFAYLLATLSSMLFYTSTFRYLDGNQEHYGNILPSYAMFPGGFVGALCVCGAAFLLYSSDSRGWLGKAIVCSLGGGIIAVIGFEVGSRIEPLIIGHASPPGHQVGVMTLFIVWQAGVGALIGGMLGAQQPESSVS